MKQFAENMQKLLAYLWVAFVVFFGGGEGVKSNKEQCYICSEIIFWLSAHICPARNGIKNMGRLWI